VACCIECGGHGSKYWEEILIPGRQDKSERNTNPVIRSADLIVAPRIFFPKIDKELRVVSKEGRGVETPRPDINRFADDRERKEYE
jgi:hypothetical protein